MRKLTILLGVLFVLLLAMAAYFLIGGTLSAEVRVMTAPASEYPEAFEAVRSVLEAGTAPQLFANPALGDAGQYTLVDVTITLANRGLFPAEWLDVRASAANGDVAVYSLTGEGGSVEGRGSGQVNLKLITTAPADAARAFTIQYYVFGMKRTILVD